MRVSLDWLSNYVDITGLTAEEIAARITVAGLEVEGIQKTDRIDNLVVGYVKKCAKHPDADKLSLCTVTDGVEDFQIVCGAPNVAADQLVVLAKIGAVLPGNFKIKPAKIRGTESFGMLCSERELGLSEGHDGIIVLTGDIKPGADANEILGLGDTVLEIGITPNRGDCLSVYGVARDVAAVFSREIKKPEIKISEQGGDAAAEIGVRVETADCPYYTLRLIRGVKMGQSPLWMQRRLRSAGLRPINNVVDVTNYVMMEYGQPLHAFDRRVIDRSIVVRKAKNGEKLTTLDGKERTLDDKMTVIADESKILGLAGVMGGEDSGVYDDTVDIALECAYFTPQSTSYTSRKLGINSDSAYRYIRGIDSGNTAQMQDYAANMIAEICGGVVCKGIVSGGEKLPPYREIETSVAEIDRLIGEELSQDIIIKLLSGLGISVTADGSALHAKVPSWRPDITHGAGLAEEVARLYGLDKLPMRLPAVLSDGLAMSRYEQERRRIRYQLADSGFTETVNYSFMSKDYLSMFYDESKLVPLVNPLSEEMSTLRPLLFPGIIKVLETNWNQGERSLRFFEFATAFEKSGEKLPTEHSRLAMGVMGDFLPLSWENASKADTFFRLKGVCENILRGLKLEADYSVADLAFLHPGKSALIKVNGQVAGYIGSLHPDLEDSLDLKAPVYIAELDFDLLLSLSSQFRQGYEQFSKFPSIYKDISVILPKDRAYEDMEKIISSVSPFISGVTLFDLYTGKGIGENEQSMTCRVYFSAMDRTLTDDEINPLLAMMADKLNRELGAKQR